MNNSINQNNNQDALNPFMLNKILPLLLSKLSFKYILELSLISKSVFKFIQNLICNQSKELNIILGSCKQLKSYIDNSKEENYIYKLIQYKDIIYINCKFNDSIFKREEINDYSQHQIIKDSNKKFKEFLNSTCPNLKRVHLIKHVYAATFGRALYDFTEMGFFSFEGLWIQIDDDCYPISNKDEEDKVYGLLNGDYEQDQDEDPVEIDKDETKLTARTFNYSYDLINNYQPRKVVLSCADELSGAYGIHIYNFNNIVNFKSIQVLKFNDEPTKPELIKKLLQSDTIRSLQLNYSPNGYYNDCDGDEEMIDDTKDYSIELSNVLEEGQLSKNTVLEKLAFANWNNTCIYKDPLPFLKLLDSIKDKTRLSKLDLYGFDIQDSALLKPLIQIPNISTLYYHFDELNTKRNDLGTLDAYFTHLNENSNIKTLKCSLLYRYLKGHQHLQYTQLFNKFDQFFNSGNKSLEILFIKINFDFYDFNLPKVNDIKAKITELLLKSSNKSLKLIWKFDNFTTTRYD